MLDTCLGLILPCPFYDLFMRFLLSPGKPTPGSNVTSFVISQVPTVISHRSPYTPLY